MLAMDNLLIQQVVADQSVLVSAKKRGVLRQIDYQKHIKSKQISVISGIRRAGKSTLMLQLADNFSAFHFITFDDERLINFQVSDFNTLMVELNKIKTAKVIIIDEVQNIEGWERFVRRLHDEEYKVILSGSNSKLLSSELATHLTGRYIKTELYPFSFSEYLQLHQIDHNDKTTSNIASINKLFDQYLEKGGFPEYCISDEDEYLKRIYEDVLYRDLIVRFGIKNIKGFKNLSQYLFTNFTKETNYNTLAGLLGFSSTTSVRDYISFLSESYMLFELYRYDLSLKKQYSSNKKIYAIDNGLRNKVSFRLGSDLGQLLENTIFIELKRRGVDVWYYKTKNNLEVDFLWFNNEPELLQICYDLSSPSTFKREVIALETAMTDFNVQHSTIISYTASDRIETTSGIITVIPAWKWLL
jgi:predicted AAA+ superfamily ATPase